MSNPYFYIIEHISSKRYYAGVRYAEGCDSSELLAEDGYCTSSNTVKKIIEEEGIQSFSIRKIRIFKSIEAAYEYETKFLRRVKAKSNDRFINRSENYVLGFGTEEFQALMIEKYGVENPSQLEEFRSKVRAKNMTNLGVPYPMMSDEVKMKSSKTVKDKYGFENVFQSDVIKEKLVQTNLDRFGVPYPMMSEQVRETRRKNNLQKYGVENPSQLKEVKDKAVETSRERYGVDHPMQTQELRRKVVETCIQRYGGTSPSASPIVKQKQKNSMLERHGTLNPLDIGNNRENMKKGRKSKRDREVVQNILSLKKPLGYNNLGRGWYQRSDEALEEIYQELLSLQD